MPSEISRLQSGSKLLFEIPLKPTQGHRFQPTGFPDLGAATFDTEGGRCLLVESPQSMANRMESVCWDEAKQALVDDLKGLSYVRVVDDKTEFLTSSILEAHRLNSVYIERSNNGEFFEMLKKELGLAKDRPISRAPFVRGVLKYDIGSLVHGVFLESIDGRLRIARALTAFIEAEGVEIVASGGVKNDHVKPGTENNGEDRKTAKEGYGNVPFHRDEYAAKKISLFVSLDLAHIRGYGFAQEITGLLVLFSLYKLRAILDRGLRLRTACDFAVVGGPVKATNADFALPPLEEIAGSLRSSIEECKGQFAKNDGITTVTYTG